MSTDYIRLCPTCGTENDPGTMRCQCGAMLAGLDMVLRQQPPATAPAPVPAPVPAAAPVLLCTYDDCAQPNPPGSTNCLYCNRPLQADEPVQAHSLLTLPAALKDRYRIVEALPAQGAEAELLLLASLQDGTTVVAKIYRRGIHPRPDVQQRVLAVDQRHRVDVLETGTSDGHAYELMEWCRHGSLRQLIGNTPQDNATLRACVDEIGAALQATHGAGLLHRDLKPENILVRSQTPLALVLTDFGVSSLLDATQRFTGTARTLPYAAPESLSGVIDVKADYWALGMIVLEAALGRHPFAGLSDAVILHHLTTRAVDSAGLQDPALRKLVRGLLLRDPAQRWGASEVRRWLADDASLAEPREQSASTSLVQPYLVGPERCLTMEQLAVALARNWRDGVGDMANGQLLAWLRDVQKDQNAVRMLLNLRHESRMPLDVQLLKLIIHLAPGIVPTWRGESVELPAVLRHASLALKGEQAAAIWLSEVHDARVLDTYAKAGNADCASIVRQWDGACDQFIQSWAEGIALILKRVPARAPDEHADFDQLMFGKSEPTRPTLAAMHARLLAVAYDAKWRERLRQRLTAELNLILVDCPWLAELGDVASMGGAQLLVLEALLPEAHKARERQAKAAERRQLALDEQIAQVREEANAMLADLSTSASGIHIFDLERAEAMQVAVSNLVALGVRIRSAPRADLPWRELAKNMSRAEATLGRLAQLLDALLLHRTGNASWLGGQALIYIGLALLIVPAALGRRFLFLELAMVAGLLAWRIVPLFTLADDIREVGAQLARIQV